MIEPFNLQPKRIRSGVMLFLGTPKSFRCEVCGSNIFNEYEGAVFQCNVCKTRYHGE